MPKIFSASQNYLPRSGRKMRSEVGIFIKNTKQNMASENKQLKGGRPPKLDPCKHRYSFKLNDVDNARFLTMFDETGWTDKAKFIKTCLLKREIKYVKLDKAAMDYYMRLTNFHSQFRAIGVNYNQVVKHLKGTFSEKMALALLYKLERATVELVSIQRQVVGLTEEFERKYLLK
jgi:hypothetical protein